jgi:prevent-host-death family protein
MIHKGSNKGSPTMCHRQHKASTGTRELRQRASELLRRVEAGETIEITDRGRPVAVLAPLPDQRPIDRLQLATSCRLAPT